MAINRNLATQSFSLARKQVEPYMHELLNADKFSNIRGKGQNNIILTSKVVSGNTVEFKVRQTYFDTNIKHGNEILSGTGQESTYSTCYMKVFPNRFALAITGSDYESLITGQDFKEDLRKELVERGEYHNFIRLMQGFMIGLCYQSTDPATDILYTNKIWDYDVLIAKILACGINAVGADGDMISHQRIMFGQDFNDNNGASLKATIKAAIDDANFTSANSHKPNLNHFRKARKLARLGNRVTKSIYRENPIRPFKTEQDRWGYMNDKYLVLLSETQYEILSQDEEWKAQTTRSLIENSQDQPSIFTGGNYKGTVEGMMFVVEPELDKYIFNAAKKTGVSLLLGAGALGYGITSLPKVTVEMSDHQNIYEIGHSETSGIRPIKFNSKSDGTKKGTNPLLVDNGMIYCFSNNA